MFNTLFSQRFSWLRGKWLTWSAPWCALGLLCGASSWAQHAHGPAAQPAPAAQAARQPRIPLGTGAAFAPDGVLWLAGVNAQGQLFVQSAPTPVTAAPAASIPDPATAWQWSAPRVLDTGDDVVSASGETRPKLLFGPQATVLIAYTQAVKARHHDGHVRLLRSVDAGQTFSAPATVHADRQTITHRFESIGFDAQGVLHTLWVDSRDMEVAHQQGGKASYRGVGIYRNTSTDGGATFGPDIKVADHACECCRTAMSLGSDGVLRAMWRHVFAPNVRDHAFAALPTPTGRTPSAPAKVVRATFDDWRVDGCPHHGPALAAAGKGFHAVWFGIRQQGDKSVAGVRYGRLRSDGSAQSGTVRLLPDVRAEHADVAAHGPRVAVVWRSSDGMTSTAKVWLSGDGGQTFVLQTLGQVTGDNDYPRLVQQGARMVVVWRYANGVQVHELPF